MPRPLILALLILASLTRSAAAAPGVLVLFSDERAIPANGEFETALRAELGLPSADVEYSGEFLDTTRFGGPGVDLAWRDFLKRKYAGHDLRVLVAASSQALDFLLTYQEELFPGLPVIVAAVAADRIAGRTLPPNYKVLSFTYEFGKTIALARQLQPDATEIVVATGTSETDRRYEAAVRRELSALPGALPVRYLTGLPLARILAEVSALTPKSIGLSIPLFTDGAGRTRVPLVVHREVVAASGAPYYSVFSTYLGSGIVGGEMTTFAAMGTWTGQVVRELLNGASPATLSTPLTVPSHVVVDWRALQKWGLDEARLPVGTEVQFKSPTLWRQYEPLIVTVSTLVLLLVASLVALLLQRRRRDLAEAEVHAVRNEIAHLTRVSLIGELSASLAHELNQPLTAILSNAQAAQRFLQSPQPDLDTIREILTDIASDDRRAGEVIRRLRELLKKGEPKFQKMQCAEIVDSVLRLARNDLIGRDVSVVTNIDAGLPAVNGDRVQLQQVLLNLIMNAADAVKARPTDQRRIVVRASRGLNHTIELTVSDRGQGIPDDLLDKVFEPFFTTKAEGLGMGLSISRTLVEAHGGRLYASNVPNLGAKLHLVLPEA